MRGQQANDDDNARRTGGGDNSRMASNELRRATTRVVYGNCGGERQTEERELQCLSSSPPPLTTSLWPVLKTAWPSATLNVVSSEHGGRCPTCSTRAAAPSSWTPCAVAGHYRQQHRGADTVDNAAEHTRQQKRQGVLPAVQAISRRNLLAAREEIEGREKKG
uniref:Uncharacterized protein n=1 Tax=Oryza nivara TaxID=4536 RepID=A0A0E0HSM6_ORYNI